VRLNELDPVVDRFVLCESPQNFRGKPKRLFFAENRDRFARFLPKIEHVVVADLPAAPETEWGYMTRERFQRNAVSRGLATARSDDLVILSDLDEIPRASAIAEAAAAATRGGAPVVVSFEMRDYRYFINLRERWLWWNKARMARFGDIRKLQTFRQAGPSWKRNNPRLLPTLRQWKRMTLGMRRIRPWRVLADAGWHFSYLNGPAAIVEKLTAYAHVPKHEVTDAVMAAGVRRALDSASRPHDGSNYRLDPFDDSYPAFLVANRDRFAHWIADGDTLATYGG
jgi:beta-1,4-mannosyl-glycoprotein beta-1,4-N-acetylglucosaminyltransferase